MAEDSRKRGRRRARDQRILTDAFVKTAGPGEYHDGRMYGLGLRVSPMGKRTWFIRAGLNGRQVRRKLGEYPAMGVGGARDAAAIAWGKAKAGELDGPERDGPLSFQEAAERALEVMAVDTRERTIRERQRILDHDLLPKWRDRPVEEISRGDVVALVNGIAKRGSPVMANRTLSNIRAIFNALFDLELVGANPAARPKRFMKPEKPKARALGKDELKAIMKAAARKEGPEARAFFFLTLFTVQRAGAVAAARWEEFDLDERLWTIPPEEGRKFKKYPRIVPLSDGAVKAVQILQAETKPHPEYLFPARSGSKEPHFTGWHNLAKRLRKEAVVDGWSLHNVRHSFRHHGSRSLGIRADVADAVMGHAIATVGHAHYELEKSTFLLDEKREALDAWGELLAELEAES